MKQYTPCHVDLLQQIVRKLFIFSRDQYNHNLSSLSLTLLFDLYLLHFFSFQWSRNSNASLEPSILVRFGPFGFHALLIFSHTKKTFIPDRMLRKLEIRKVIDKSLLVYTGYVHAVSL